MLEWNKRAKRNDTMMAERRTWNTKCGHYKVEEHNIRYGRTEDRHGNYNGYPVYYIAMRLVDPERGIWTIISDHRNRNAAVKQCEYFHQHGHKMPPKTKTEKAVKRVKAKRKARREQKQDES